MTKEKSKKPKPRKEADEPHLKTLKNIKKHKSDKPPKPHSPNLEKLNCKTPHSDSIQTTKKKKKKKEKPDEPKSLDPKTSASDSIQNSKMEKKKDMSSSDKPSNPHSLNPEDFDSKTPYSDSIQTQEKKKKKHHSGKPRKPHSSIAEIFNCEIAADLIQTQKKKKQKLDKPHPPNTEILDSKIDTNSVETQKRKKKPKLDENQSSNRENSGIDTDSIRTPKRKKQKLDESQSSKPEKLDSEIGTDTIQSPKKKTQKSDESHKPPHVNPEMLDSEIDTDLIQNLLEPHTKDQLIEFLLDSAVKTPSIMSKIIETANQDISHRRIFVHNLDWDTTRESVVSVFEQYGELEACDVVYDRVTGKTKGFGFVIFKSRECAKNALKEPKKRIDNRIVSCQLASIGPLVVGCVDNSSRKIYVSNVEKDVDSGKLREFFEKFGEIEVGPLGFDMQTGKSKGYALFVYKNLEGVRKVLEEPNKIFDGKQLNCRMANDWNGRKKNSKSDSSVTTVMMPVPHDLSAVLPNQNTAMVGQHVDFSPMLGQSGLVGQHAGFNPMLGQSGFNPITEGLYANPFVGLLNQLLSQAGIGVNQFGQMGVGFGGYGEALGQGMGSLDWNQSVLGPFSGSPSAPMLQGWQHAYSDT